LTVYRTSIAALRNGWLKASQALDAAIAAPRLRAGRSALTDEVVAALHTEGVFVTTVEHVLGPSAAACREAIAAVAALVADRGPDSGVRWNRQVASTDLAHDELLARLPALFLFGLDAAMLAIAEQYLRVPVAYHGAVLRHSHVGGNQIGTRRWHRDAEDFHVLRTVLYLSDVTEGSGPFEYLPRGLQAQARRATRVNGVCSNDEMALHVPRESWKRCIGPAGTVVIADSAQVFHHESVQRDAPRSVLMMGHASRRPKDPELAQAHFPVHRHAAALARLVPPSLHPVVFDWRRPEHASPGEASDPAAAALSDVMRG
jgi:hypothetical protein